MGAFDLRKNRETNRKFNKQVADLKKQEKNQQTKHQIAEVGKLAKGKGGSDSVDKFLNNKEPSQKGPKRLAMDRKYGGNKKDAMQAKITDKKYVHNNFSILIFY